MARCIDLTGQKFDKWTVIRKTEKPNGVKGRDTFWLCKCECGNEKAVNGYNLRKGLSTSCGCSRVDDLTGQKFGRLTVIERAENRSNEVCWLCECECGNIKNIMARSLKNGDATSCGCYNRERVKEVNLIDLTGQKFGRLTVIKQAPNKGKETCWLCKCDCGKEKIILGNALRRKTTVSCGCYIREIVSKGGISPISNYLRALNVQWFNECKKQAHYTCQLTGKTGSNLNTHHLKSFNTIVKEAHDLHNIDIKEVIAEYTEEELKLLEEYVASWHKDNSNGIVLSEDVHKLFHSLYGKGENTPEQYMEFKERYLAGEFKEIIK